MHHAAFCFHTPFMWLNKAYVKSVKMGLKADPGEKTENLFQNTCRITHTATIHLLAKRKDGWEWNLPSLWVLESQELSWTSAEDWNKVLPSGSCVVLPGCLIPALMKPPTAHRELFSWTTQNCFWEWESIELKLSALLLHGRISLSGTVQGSGSYEHIWSTWQPNGSRRVRDDILNYLFDLVFFFFFKSSTCTWLKKKKKRFQIAPRST